MRSTYLTVCAVLASLGCAAPYQAPFASRVLVPAHDERLVVDQTVLVFDASSSISRTELFPRAKALLESFVAGMPDGTYTAAGLEFGASLRAFSPLQGFERGRLGAAARGVRYRGGWTPLDLALEDVTQTLTGSSGRAAVVIFSDGVPTRSSSPAGTLEAARSLLESYAGKVCFHTIQTGDDPAGTELLRQLSALTTCGSRRSLAAINGAVPLHQFQKEVFLDERSLPPVAAPPPALIGELGALLFDFDSAELRPTSSSELERILELSRQNPDAKIRLDGHTDSVGSELYNIALSEERAKAVRQYLVEKGIPAARLAVRALGKAHPTQSNATKQGRQANRRTEVWLVR